MKLNRRTLLYGLIGLAVPPVMASCTRSSTTTSSQPAPNESAPAASGGKAVRIGYQKATELDLLRSRGNLDRQLQQQGVAVEWSLFPSGPPMLEAMNAGKIDFGGVGESPPIFAQAAGGQFYYVGYTPLSPASQDIVVAKDAAIQSAADLKGKKVALQKGSSAHYLLLKVLAEQGIPANQVEVVSLPPADARAAFEQGNVDAWSIWDPFLAVAQGNDNIKSLKLGRERRTFFLAAQQFAKEQPEQLKVVLENAKQNGLWVKQNLQAVAEQFSQDINVEVPTLVKIYQRRSWDVLPIDAAVQASQQQVADIFYQAQVIPKSLQVQETFMASETYAKVFPS